MSQIRSYDVVTMVTDEAGEQFGAKWIMSQKNIEKLKADCDIIDQLISEFYCESTDVRIDDDKMELVISLICPDIVLEYGRVHPFFDLIKDTSSFRFSAVDGSLQVDLVFSNLWEHKD